MSTIFVHFSASGDEDGSTWQDAYTDIQDGLDAAEDGDEVWVKYGIYYPTTAYIVPEGVSLYGGFAWGLNGTDGSVSGRDETLKTIVHGQDTYQGFKLLEETTLDGWSIINCAATNGAGVEIPDVYYGDELLTDGDMEDTGTTAWSAGGGASLDKETSPVYAGSRSLEVSDADGGYAYQTVMTIGQRYRVTGYAYNGPGLPSVNDGSTVLWTHAGGSSAWEAFDETFTATATQLRLVITETETATGNFDEVSLTEVFEPENITISNCGIYNCDASGDGGGIYVNDSKGIDIDDVEIGECSAGDDGGGVATAGNSEVDLTDCYIHDNTATADGGGIHFGGTDAVTQTVLNCRIVDNTAVNGANIYEDESGSSNLEITQCVIADGTATTCGGIYCTDSGCTVTLTNCTVANNDDTGIERTAGTVSGVNCIVWGNDTQISGTVTMTYSDIEGGYSGTGNVNDDPEFYGTGKHAYALSSISDAVDSGNAGASNYQSTDLLSQSRYDHPDVTNTGAGSPAYSDMGAYEYQGSPPNTFPMGGYYLNFDGTDPGNYYYHLYAIVRLPEMPTQFGSVWQHISSDGPISVRHQIQSEIQKLENDSTLEEFVYIDGSLAAYRDVTTATSADPTRSLGSGYEPGYQSDGSAHVAEDKRYPTGVTFSQGPGIPGDYYRFVVLDLVWYPEVDNSLEDKMKIYNVDIAQIHDESYSFDDFEPAMHPGNTVFAPDVPLSAWHVRCLQHSLLKILYESVFNQSMPVFGQYTMPIV